MNNEFELLKLSKEIIEALNKENILTPPPIKS